MVAFQIDHRQVQSNNVSGYWNLTHLCALLNCIPGTSFTYSGYSAVGHYFNDATSLIEQGFCISGCAVVPDLGDL